MRSLWWIASLAAAFGAVLVVAGGVQATHLRGGTLAWEPTGIPDEANFTGTIAWRASSWTAPAVGDVLRAGAVPVGFLLHTGDGASEVFRLEVTYLDAAEDWLLSRIVDASLVPGVRHVYPAPSNAGAPWHAYWTECCRLTNLPPAEHVNNPGDATTLATTVDLRAGNAAPRVWVPPVYACGRDALCRVPVTVAEPDGDPVTLRFSTSHEAIGSGQPPAAPAGNSFDPPGPPWSLFPAALDAAVPELAWDTTGVFMGFGGVPLYSAQFMVEDGATKTPMDFLIKIQDPDPPHWRTPPSPCGATLGFPAGLASSFTVEAAHNDSARRVGLLVSPATPLDGFPGATSPLPAPGNPVAATFTWTPPASAIGEVRRIAYWAHAGSHWADPCVVALRVVDPPVADFGCQGVPGVDGRMRFTDLSMDTGAVVAWAWQFGDGATSGLRDPVHDYAARGAYNVSLTVTDDDGLAAGVQKTCVAPGNRPPVFAPVGGQVVHEGDRLAFAVFATDPDGDAVVVRMEPSSTARFAGGVFSWSPILGMRGGYDVRFVASDGRLADALAVRVTVLPTPEERAPTQGDADGDGWIDAHDACPAQPGADGCASAPAADASAVPQATDGAPPDAPADAPPAAAAPSVPAPAPLPSTDSFLGAGRPMGAAGPPGAAASTPPAAARAVAAAGGPASTWLWALAAALAPGVVVVLVVAVVAGVRLRRGRDM